MMMIYFQGGRMDFEKLFSVVMMMKKKLRLPIRRLTPES